MSKLNLDLLQSEKPEIKYHCAKRAIALSAKNPKALYPDLDTFVKLLDGDNNVLKWVSIIVIGNLASVDKQNKINKLVPKLIGFLREKSLITASNSIGALGKIAKYKPQYMEKIFVAFIAVEKAAYISKGKISPECRNVVLGHVLDVFTEFKDIITNQKEVVNFIKRQTKNTRLTVQKKAVQLEKSLKLKSGGA
jgi:hypothetical protein